jgi:hypothetical protein
MDESQGNNPDNISGFVQNVSPLKKGPKKKYFDFNLQIDKDTSIRGVCFSHGKHKLFTDVEEQSKPVKLSRFVYDGKDGSTDILISDNVVMQHLKEEDLSFPQKEIPTNLNISNLSSLSVNQLITLKGKVINLQKPQKVHMGDCLIEKAEALLVDTHGSIQIVF